MGSPKRLAFVFVAITVVSFLVGGVYTRPSSAGGAEAGDIIQNMVGVPKVDPTISLNTLVKAINSAGLAGTLKGKGPFTVFAPTDNAFSKLPSETWGAVSNDQAKLKMFLMGLVVSGSLGTNNLSNGTKLKTLAGTTLEYKALGPAGFPAINDGSKDSAIIKKTPLQASNGVLWILDGVPGL